MASAPARRERLTPRVLSTADERREEVLRAAMEVMSTRVFRLFPTKLSLFLAVVERSFQQIQETLERAARAAGATGEPALMAMAAAYTALLEDPGILLVQLQAQAAASEPEVRDSLRRGFADLLDMVERVSGASPQRVQQFFARGMLCNVSAAQVLASADAEGSTAT
jgi:AcrR family transcriptional regulator